MDEYFTEPSNAYIYKGHNLTNLRTSFEMSDAINLNLSILNLLIKYAETNRLFFIYWRKIFQEFL